MGHFNTSALQAQLKQHNIKYLNDMPQVCEDCAMTKLHRKARNTKAIRWDEKENFV